MLLRTVSGCYEGLARRRDLPRPRPGAVAFVQRFDSGLRRNVHCHVLCLDGVFAHAPGRGTPEFDRPGIRGNPPRCSNGVLAAIGQQRSW